MTLFEKYRAAFPKAEDKALQILVNRNAAWDACGLRFGTDETVAHLAYARQLALDKSVDLEVAAAISAYVRAAETLNRLGKHYDSLMG